MYTLNIYMYKNNKQFYAYNCTHLRYIIKSH